MNIIVNEKMIMERCGLLAFNRGKQYMQKNKVQLSEEEPGRYNAIVSGVEDFHVKISGEEKFLETTCTCPKIASFNQDCQHVAAVLHAILRKQNEEASKDLLHVLGQSRETSFTKQTYFETRRELEIHFTFKIIQESHSNIVALLITIENNEIESVEEFFNALKKKKNYKQDGTVIFDFNIHCFSKDTATILDQLIHLQHAHYHGAELEVPPSIWEVIFPMIEGQAFASYDDTNSKLTIYEEKKVLPLQFIVHKPEENVLLEIDGIEELILLSEYETAVYDGLFYRLKKDAVEQLIEIQTVLEKYHEIAIPEEQLLFFNEKVLPKLHGFGEVTIAKEIRKHLDLPVLKAKLFLDRVNHRLLASLEFHYNYFVIYPLEEQKETINDLVVRDEEKEKFILSYMEKAEFYQNEGGYILQNEELEYEFLHDILPELEKHVEVYATTAVRNRIMPLPAKPKIKIKQQPDRLDWLEFKFEIEGFVEKEVKEILQAIEQKRRYYRLRSGALLSLESRELEEIHAFLQQAQFLDVDMAEFHFETSVVMGMKLIDLFKKDDSLQPDIAFLNFLEKTYQPDPAALRLLDGFEAELRDYQKQGYQWMHTLADYGFGGLLADDMGLGKTVQSIAFIHSRLTEIRKNSEQIVIVCPAAVLYHWKNEFNKFSPNTSVMIVDGNQEKRQRQLSHIRKYDVIITSYAMLRSDIDWYRQWKFHTIFFDEAQSFKNPRTQTARALKKLQSKNRFALTGTPIENNMDELWSIFHIIFSELFGGYEAYSQLSRKKIKRRIKPFMLRRMKKEVAIELPEKIEQTEVVELYPEQKKIYTAYLAKLRHENLKHLDKDTDQKNRIRMLAGITRLRQICCHPSLFVDNYQGKSAKLTRLLAIIQEAQATERRMLIFSQFTSMLQIIARHLAQEGVSFLYLDGETAAEDREELSSRFNQGERDVFLISLKAGGTGLNLTGADTVILYDLWWNPAVEEQAADRAYRIGQKKNVHVIKLLAKGTIEEKMNQLQHKKRDLIKEVMDIDVQPVKSLTLEDIKELLE